MTQEASAPASGDDSPPQPTTYDEYFNFDDTDNLLGFKAAAPSTDDFGFNIDNQLSSPAGFSFDSEGSMTAEPTGGLYAGATLTYDPEDRLSAITSPSFAAAYDGDENRR